MTEIKELNELKEVIHGLKEIKSLLCDISVLEKDIFSVSDDDRKMEAIRGAIEFKTKSGVRYLTYSENGEKYLVLVDTEDNSTICFKVESIKGGINYEKFHPEKMFEAVITAP